MARALVELFSTSIPNCARLFKGVRDRKYCLVRISTVSKHPSADNVPMDPISGFNVTYKILTLTGTTGMKL